MKRTCRKWLCGLLALMVLAVSTPVMALADNETELAAEEVKEVSLDAAADSFSISAPLEYEHVIPANGSVEVTLDIGDYGSYALYCVDNYRFKYDVYLKTNDKKKKLVTQHEYEEMFFFDYGDNTSLSVKISNQMDRELTSKMYVMKSLLVPAGGEVDFSYIAEADGLYDMRCCTAKNVEVGYEYNEYNEDECSFINEAFIMKKNEEIRFHAENEGDKDSYVAISSKKIPSSGTTNGYKWSFDDDTLTISGKGSLDLSQWQGDDLNINVNARNYSLKKLVIDEGFTKIVSLQPLHYYIRMVAEIELPSTVTSIDKNAFFVEKVKFSFPNGNDSFKIKNNSVMTADGKRMLYINSEDKNYVFDNLVQAIDDSALKMLSSAETITLGNKVKDLDTFVFGTFYSLKAIKVAEDNPNYASKSGVLYSKDGTVLYTYPCKKTTESYSIGSKVTTIAYCAFCYAKGLKKLTIPKTVKTIEKKAFIEDEFDSMKFLGHAPSKSANACYRVNAKVYYPIDDSSWTKTIRKKFDQEWAERRAELKEIYGNSDPWYEQYLTWKTYGESSGLKKTEIASIKNANTGVQLKWNKSDKAEGYYVYRKSSSDSSYKKIKTVAADKQTYTDKDAPNGTSVTYKVVAYKGDKKSEFTTKKWVYLKRAEITSLTSPSAGKITVKWAKNSKADGYQIYYATKSDFSNKKSTKVSKAATVSKTIGSLTKGKKYYVKVRSYVTKNDKKYYSAWSASKNVTTKK